MNTLQPSIDVLLQGYFSALRRDAAGIARSRIDIVEEELRDFLETAGHRGCTSGGLAILEAERQFDPNGAFARAMHADDLIFALPDYLAHAAGDHLLRRDRLRHVDGLAARIIRTGLLDAIDYACPLLDLRVALDRGRDELKRMRRETKVDQHRHGIA